MEKFDSTADWSVLNSSLDGNISGELIEFEWGKILKEKFLKKFFGREFFFQN